MKTVLAITCVVLVACSDLQFGPSASATTYMSISAVVDHDSQTRIIVHASLNPGRDANGRPREFLDSALYVNGTKVIPEIRSAYWEYSWAVTRPAANVAAESLLVSVPRRSAADSFVAVIGIPARLDPRNITLGPAEDLKLHLTTAGALGVPDSASRSWSLDLAAECAGFDHFMTISARTPYPAETRVQWEQLPASRPQTFQACFETSVFYIRAAAPYRLFAGVFMRADWVVQLQP